jgi:hypothetical protein
MPILLSPLVTRAPFSVTETVLADPLAPASPPS